MKSSLVPLLLGLAFVGGAIGIHQQQQSLQRADVRDVAALRAELDSVRAAVANAPAGPDSTRLAENVAQRTYLLGRREYHVPYRQETIDNWWSLSGPGTVLALIGGLLLAVAAVVRYRGAGRSDSLV